MTNPFYTPTGAPTTQSRGSSASIRAEFTAISTGLDGVNTALAAAAITSGAINNATIGATTPSTGNFTNLSSTGNTTLGDATTDTLNVGAGGIVKNASGNVTMAGALTVTGAATTGSAATGDLSYTGTLTGGTGVVNLGSGQFYKDASGNVGINVTPTSAAKLSVNGGLIVTGGLTLGTTASPGYFSNDSPIFRQYTGDGTGYTWALSKRSGSVTTDLLRLQDSTGVLALTGATISSGTGIAFPATQVASANANTFDDYAEGIWTPTITFSTPGDLAVTYTTRNGYFTKKGREVTVRFEINTSAFTYTTAGGPIRITGLPYTAANLGNYDVGGLVFSGYVGAANPVLSPVVEANVAYVSFRASGSGAAVVNVSATQFASGSNPALIGTITYIAP